MKFTIRRLAGVLLSVGLLLAAASTSWADTIKIGIAAPFSGDLASYGIPARNGAELAIRDINAAGGVMGMQLEAVAEDDVCEPNTAANVAQKMVSEGVVGVIGHLCSGATEAALPTYLNAQIPVISAASTNPTLTLDSKYPNFFRTIAHDAAQATLQVDFAVKALEIKRAAVIHDKGTYGKGLAELVKAGLEANDVQVALFEGVTPGAVSYSALVSKLRREDINSADGTAVFFGGYHPEASKIVTEARKGRNNAYFISGDGVKDPSFLKIADKYALEFYVSAPVDVSKVPKAQSVTADYRELYGNDPGTFSLQAYAAVQALAEAIKQAGGTDFNQVAAAMKQVQIESSLGQIGFDENGDVVGAGFAMFQVRPTPNGINFVPAY
jgi:branched-chain amino acid transport system substrate-binding protein